MGLSKKYKQHWAQIIVRAAESEKHRKIDQENQRWRRFLRKQREEEDFWDEREDFWSKSGSDKSDFVESSFDGYNSVEENLDDGENEGGDCTQKELGDNDVKVQLEVKGHIIQPVCNNDASEYLRSIGGSGSSATEKREQRCKKEVENPASTTRSIVDLFSARFNKNKSWDERVLSTSLPAVFLPNNTGNEVKETRFESQTQDVHDLSELLCLKTVQIDKYGQVLDHQSNLYRRYPMVQSFLWMQLNKKKDNSSLNQQGLVQIDTNSFNRRAYTGRKII